METQLKLSPRLLAVARQVRQGVISADVGTDHGYLACHLAYHHICPKVYASDLNRGPLEQAVRTVRDCGLEGKVIPLLSDGVRELPLDEISDIAVAGMGGDLILSIISDFRLRSSEKRLILQPMTKTEVLRRGLYKMGFELYRETAVRDGRFVYTVLTARYTGKKREIDEFFAQVGLLMGKTEEEKACLNRVLSRVEKKLAGIRRSGSGETKELEQLAEMIKERILNGKGERNPEMDG